MGTGKRQGAEGLSPATGTRKLVSALGDWGVGRWGSTKLLTCFSGVCERPFVGKTRMGFACVESPHSLPPVAQLDRNP